MTWDKADIVLDNGSIKENVTAPCIISASRSTDIPAFYSDWFFYRLKKGYCVWNNPFSITKCYVSFDKTRFIVFWSKNPEPLISHLDELKSRNINCYIQFTLNDYFGENLENGVPPLNQRIDTFKRLVDRLGYGHVVWRFDPLILTDRISEELLLEKISGIAEQLKGYTEKLVFSFADILSYRKVQRNLEESQINYHDWTFDEMSHFASGLSAMNKSWKLTLATCAEKIDLSKFNIQHNKCIDDELIIQIAWKDEYLMKKMGVEIYQRNLLGDMPENAIILDDYHYAVRRKSLKDSGQRVLCGCMASKDIGQYNTCVHQCEYCYANSSKQLALRNYKSHLKNPYSETIIGE